MSRNEVRIIGGLWKGRKLKVPAGAAVRPSLGRVRETLFNWLAGEVVGSDCLDLFAGSGALGFEALSRGARSVVLVDNNRNTAAVLRKNAQRLGAANCTVRRQSALAFLKLAAGARSATGTRNRGGLASSGTDTGAPAGESRMTAPRADDGVGEAVLRWDIVFLDPPFSSNLLPAALEAIQGGNALNPGARIYFELERRSAFDAHGFTILKEGAAGDTRFGLLASP
ncbi:MAG: 16S rRNA (guanine(966)-N(2))-methyltransferase RsmD [Gammaproteobacteria bacterium]|nr:16S rRNA (guanine(966)-N(2))-methyltransferase RsmD [Gammaproteobacteria bacterium]MDE0367370.1 16S rRNA (guanine(966)-N(2))-methyltransferase RsmD [Gammaproteobacteria bacterium]